MAAQHVYAKAEGKALLEAERAKARLGEAAIAEENECHKAAMEKCAAANLEAAKAEADANLKAAKANAEARQEW